MTSANLAIAGASAETAEADTWSNAPFDMATKDAIRSIVGRLGAGQRLWLSGFLAGSASTPAVPLQTGTSAAAATTTILFGSQSGNSEKIARQLADVLGTRRIDVRVLDMLDCRNKDLDRTTTLLVVVSTQGDGDPPDRAIALHELLSGKRAPRLGHLRFAVLALGDSSYDNFCATGRDFDVRLEALGATRLEPRVDCDVDFAAKAGTWIASIADKIAAETAPAELARPARAETEVADTPTRARPFGAAVLANQRLTARGSSKDVRHVELSLAGSGIRYEPGDALGIVPRNRTEDVDALLEAARLGAETPVESGGRSLALRDALLERDIGAVKTPLLRRYAAAIANDRLAALETDELELARYAQDRHLLDVVTEYAPHGIDAVTFLALLKPLAPRLYSISSSPSVAADEAHLTVGIVEYEALGRGRRGVVSGLVAVLAEGASILVYLHRNPTFRLPRDAATNIVMIGAGTGVAPFRSFVAEREATGATGGNWLFFGDRSFELDFLYQSEWLGWRKRRVLTNIDVAFSRDQTHKIYVQQRIRERGDELWTWLQNGAVVYVCGDAARLAPDVDRALHEVARVHGGLDEDGAREYWLDLKRNHRYQRDVY